jgi:hypothetical protein
MRRAGDSAHKNRSRFRGQHDRNLRYLFRNLSYESGRLIREDRSYRGSGTHTALSAHRLAPALAVAAGASIALACAARKCIRSTIIPNLIRSSNKRDINPTRPLHSRHLGENGYLSGKAISRSISSSLLMPSITVEASLECTTAMCRLMFSVQTWSDLGAWVPNFNRDGKFTSRRKRLSQFQCS